MVEANTFGSFTLNKGTLLSALFVNLHAFTAPRKWWLLFDKPGVEADDGNEKRQQRSTCSATTHAPAPACILEELIGAERMWVVSTFSSRSAVTDK